MEKTYKYNAVFNGKHYDHFGIHPKLGSLYGDKPEDIVEVELKISDDQNIPISSDNKNMIFDYKARTFVIEKGKNLYEKGIEKMQTSKNLTVAKTGEFLK